MLIATRDGLAQAHAISKRAGIFQKRIATAKFCQWRSNQCVDGPIAVFDGTSDAFETVGVAPTLKCLGTAMAASGVDGNTRFDQRHNLGIADFGCERNPKYAALRLRQITQRIDKRAKIIDFHNCICVTSGT